MFRPARLAAAATCWVTALCYSSFVFAAWCGSRLPVSRSYVSELEAVGQPDRTLFRLSDVVSGLGLVVLAILAVPLLSPGVAARIACGLLGVAGIASLFDAANSMSCAPSIDAVCRSHQDTASGLITQVTQAHTTSSLVGFLATAGVLLMFGTAATVCSAEPDATGPAFARTSMAAAIGTAVLGLVDVVLILTNSVIGISERARILVFSLWLLVLGVQLQRSARVRETISGPARR